MIPYPDIPQPLQSLSGQESTPVIRTDLENGLVTQQGRYSTILRTYALAWEFSDTQFQVFEEWFNETLAGGALVFELQMVHEGAIEGLPFRFVAGTYAAILTPGGQHRVSAVAECLQIGDAAANRTPPVPQWYRIGLDPLIDQELTFAHRNALLTARPDLGSVTTVRIYPPTDPTQYIYFGIDNQGEGDTLITSVDVDPIPTEPTPSFPGSLPGVDHGLRDSGSRMMHRLDMDGGNPRQWVAYDTTLKQYSVTWTFTLEQLATFQEFFFTTLKSGSLPFTIELPVEGTFVTVVVTFVGGSVQESYASHNHFKVSALLERHVEQTETPAAWQPYGLYYSPTVNVTVNRKVLPADAGKFFVVNPDLGQTISLHIYDELIEFGVLNIGLGNILITRGPFIMDIGALADTGAGAFEKPVFSLADTIHDIGTLPVEIGAGEFLKTAMDMISVVEDIGTIPLESGSGEFSKPLADLLDVLVDTGTILESGNGTFGKTTIEMI